MILGISSNLLIRKLNSPNVQNNGAVTVPSFTQNQPASTNLLEQYLNAQAVMNAPIVNKAVAVDNNVQTSQPYKNDLRTLFNTNRAKILAIMPRAFTAVDKNGNDYINPALRDKVKNGEQLDVSDFEKMINRKGLTLNKKVLNERN